MGTYVLTFSKQMFCFLDGSCLDGSFLDGSLFDGSFFDGSAL